MPLFSSPSPQQDPPDVRRRSTLGFSRNRDTESSASSSPSPGRSGSILTRFRERSSDSSASLADDPVITAARQKLIDAIHAERDVDRALDAARQAVKEARQHVKNVEATALEEARRARAKQAEAKTMRRGANRLGRHDHHQP